jgi:hypothetical protein
MFKQRPFGFSLLILALLITFYSVGDSLVTYWSSQQFDLLINTLTGLWVSLVILGLAAYFGQFSNLRTYKFESFMVAFVSATLIGVIWQLVLNLYSLTNVYADDYQLKTALYIFTNSLGGSLAHFYFVKRKKKVEKVVEVAYPFAEQGAEGK